MKHLLISSLTALVLALPAFANTPSESTSSSTKTESMKSSTTPSDSTEEMQKMEERTGTSTPSGPHEPGDAQMQQDASKVESSTTTTTEEKKVE